jgi:hypothetical protein
MADVLQEFIDRRARERAARPNPAFPDRAAVRTCGDAGGRDLNGALCQHAAGHGTGHLGTGRCREHDQGAG